MSERFEVGEVAIYVRVGSDYRGDEVLITGPLGLYEWLDDHDVRHLAIAYPISHRGENSFIAEPHELRKRRPPRDWVRLCALDTVEESV